ncbi:MAG: glycogen-debranching protein [Austwickia sp.]|jgi:isoamylase|nr:glycogen-debranching protein [Austwickia sp.]MBK8437603.1 glycogen-debranching protein [Austwickia sp.]MBK9102869.1 glycogen-debranching protein [Austwickia sp.]
MTILFPKPTDDAAWERATWPLGVTYHPDRSSATFAVHAPAATRVLLEIYPEALGADALTDVVCVRGDEDGVWRAEVSQVGPGALYAYRCWGANWPFDPAWERGGSGAGFVADVDEHGNRFNPNKVLFDPYAREITHNVLDPAIDGHDDQGMFGTGGQQHCGRPRRELDTGRIAPKGIIIVDDTRPSARPKAAPEKAAIYEAHITNLTMHPSSSSIASLLADVPGFDTLTDVPANLRGTYAGAAMMAPYLAALGLTTIELLPIHETNSSPEAERAGSVNHWGYQTLSFFSPNRSYAADQSYGGPTREFKEMVSAFHRHGIEVYLDVVYNHTAEGGHWDSDIATTGFVSLGGFATADYYVMNSENMLIDGATGCSNQVNASSAATHQLVLDSLRYYAEDMGVDGFRFDLATVLGRTPDAHDRDDWENQRVFHPDHPLLLDIAKMADELGIEVIAEAWDLWGYEVGNFPDGWGEWNGRYRDAIRGFLKGDGNTCAFMDMVNGDYAHFHSEGAGIPARSVNFVTAHDGFTMMDLVSYSEKNNDTDPPFGPSDGGSDDNVSWDSGGDPALRRTRLRNFLTVLFLSKGVPMIVAGDEYGRTQNGNNNPWCLNTIGMWSNYAQGGSNAPMQMPVDPKNPDAPGMYYDVFGEADCEPTVNPILAFTSYLAHLRQRNKLLRPESWGSLVGGESEAAFHFTAPGMDRGPEDGDRALAFRIDAGEDPGNHGDLFMMVAMTTEPVSFAIPEPNEGTRWRRLIDTSPSFERDHNCWRPEDSEDLGDHYEAQPWSIVVLEEIPFS